MNHEKSRNLDFFYKLDAKGKNKKRVNFHKFITEN